MGSLVEVRDGMFSSLSSGTGGGAGVPVFLAAADFFSEAVVGLRTSRGLAAA